MVSSLVLNKQYCNHDTINTMKTLMQSSHTTKSRFFQVIIGNPPYQSHQHGIDKIHDSKHIANASLLNVFQDFQLVNELNANIIGLIYPAGRWLDKTGRNMSQLHDTILTDHHTANIICYMNAKENKYVFTNVGIFDGISIVMRTMHEHNDNILMKALNDNHDDYVSRMIPISINNSNAVLTINPIMNNIIMKMLAIDSIDFKPLGHYTRNYYRLSNDYVYELVNKKESNIIMKCDEKSPLKKGYVKAYARAVVGLNDSKPEWFHIRKDMIAYNDTMNAYGKYKVIISSSNFNGYRGCSMHMMVLKPGEICGQSRVQIYISDNMNDINAFITWFSTDVIRFTWASTGLNLGSLGYNTPNYNDSIRKASISINDDTAVMNKKLIEYYKLTDDEVTYIHDYVSKLGSIYA